MFVVDSCLAPIGLAIAFAAQAHVVLVALAVPLVALLRNFSQERQRRIDHALELSDAYRGTAFLLGDVVEADDEYTGAHSRHVVDLVLDVCDDLGLPPDERRDAEFVALLHDVGKIRIPGSIINKPGPLDPDERALIETHTVEGQVLLERVGGLLGHVGRIVRSCHESWDGSGYPDGLAGEAIPLIARIVSACDAFSAMTTDPQLPQGTKRGGGVPRARALRGDAVRPARRRLDPAERRETGLSHSRRRSGGLRAEPWGQAPGAPTLPDWGQTPIDHQGPRSGPVPNPRPGSRPGRPQRPAGTPPSCRAWGQSPTPGRQVSKRQYVGTVPRTPNSPDWGQTSIDHPPALGPVPIPPRLPAWGQAPTPARQASKPQDVGTVPTYAHPCPIGDRPRSTTQTSVGACPQLRPGAAPGTVPNTRRDAALGSVPGHAEARGRRRGS